MLRPSSVYRRIPGFRRVKRAWRSRGFGIHSPFAFRFISRVLRERGEYYAYGELRRVAGTQKRFRELSLLFRLVCHFRPAAVGVMGEIGEDECAAVRLAESRTRVFFLSENGRDRSNGSNRSNGSDGISLLILGGECGAGALARAAAVLDGGGAVVCQGADADMLAGLKPALRSGMTFTNGHTAVIVGRPDLPRQDFELNF